MSILAPWARLVGNRINRKEDPRLLTGRGRYVDDIVVPGMLHVAGAIGAPAAVANAVNDALALVGAHVLTAPFTPARIVDALAAVGH